MAKQNCWEFRKCGREIGGKHSEEFGVCPAANNVEADGFCDGKNGGRACRYVLNTLCDGVCQTTYEKKDGACCDCEFRKQLKNDHPLETNIFAYVDYITKHNKKKPGASK